MECFKLPEHYFDALRGKERNLQKEKDMAQMLKKAACCPLRPNTYRSVMNGEKSREDFSVLLSDDGVFADLEMNRNGWSTAIKRLTCLIVMNPQEESIPEKWLRGVIYYGKQEILWENRGPVRFHDSCFALPVCAVNMYFALLPTMREIKAQGELWISFYNVLCELMLQAWTLPERGDATDQTPFCKNRFQNHVWWMGGNALAYRPVFYTALCFGDSRLMDVLGDVILEAAASRASKEETAFWTEGICADGFGWGHGSQAYNSGYPTDSLREMFDIMKFFKGTAFEEILERMDWENIFRYISGISWSSYGTYIPPMMGRVCFSRKGKQESTTEMMEDFAHRIADDFADYVDGDALRRLKDAAENGTCEGKDESNEYHGTRYFFNNDTLISKNRERYFYFNTASSRCKGVECAHEMADKRNFYIRDGSYILLTNPESYEDVKGTYNPCHFPGTTERDLPKEAILEETNWSGYNSIHNFAGGLGDGSCGAAGFIYEKNPCRYADGAGIVRNVFTREMLGVKAYKSVFVWKDLFVFLGAGIEDKNPEYGSHIITTVNNVRMKDYHFCSRDGKAADAPSCYLYNDGCLYGIMETPDTRLLVHAEKKMTDWKYLNYLNKDVLDEEVPVLELMIDHGAAPTESSYRYWISASLEKTPQEIEESFRILENSKNVQAVQLEQNTVMAVFFQPSRLQWGKCFLEVSAPCVLMMKQQPEGVFDVLLSDPCQNPEVSVIEVSVKRSGQEAHAAVQMPSGKLRGSQCRIQMKFKKPNIIMVFPDQLQHDALHFRGKMPSLTPNLDAFVKESVMMENCMSNHPLCSPFRAMMLTGKYGIHTGVVGNCRTGNRELGCYLKKSEICITDVLRENGYDVGYIGKWHLDPPDESHIPYTEGYRSDGYLWDSYTLPQRRHGINFWHAFGCCDKHMAPHYWHNDAKPEEAIYPKQWSVEHEADTAVDYIMNRNQVRDEEKPFMLFVAHNPPHPPYDRVPQNYVDLYRDKTAEELLASPCFNVQDTDSAAGSLKQAFSNGAAEKGIHEYLGAVTGVDENFGRILKAVKEKGLYENTIVIFSSDHGDMMGSHNLIGKATWYRDSFNIPFIIRYPGHLLPSNPKMVMGAVDMMPTILGLAGLRDQIPAGIDGTDYSENLLSGTEDEDADALYFQFNHHRVRGLKTKKYTFVSIQNYLDDESFLLYDDENDYYQLHDISGERPDITKKLKARLEERLKEIGDNWRD